MPGVLRHEWRHWLTIGLALLSHAVAEQLHKSILFVSDPRLRDTVAVGPTWEMLGRAVVIGAGIAAGMLLKGGFYGRSITVGRLAFVGLVAVQCLGLLLHHMSWSGPEWVALAICVAVVVYLSIRFRQAAVDIYDSAIRTIQTETGRRRVQREDLQPRPGLLLFLSYLVAPRVFSPDNATHETKEGNLVATREWEQYRELMKGLAAQVKASGFDLADSRFLEPFGRYNVRMPLESIRYQLLAGRTTPEGLRAVAVVPSADKLDRSSKDSAPKPVAYTGSAGQFEFFREVCLDVFGPFVSPLSPLQLSCTEPADFEDKDDLSAAIREGREMLLRSHAESHYVDVTRGQVICSIVGAIRSLAEGDRTVYISTRDYKPLVYNFVADRMPEIG